MGAGSVLVSTDHGRVDLDAPIQLPSRIRLSAHTASIRAQVPSVCQRANRL
jgi:hypothetical protein